MLLQKPCCDLNLGESRSIFAFFLFPNTGLQLSVERVLNFILIWRDTENQQYLFIKVSIAYHSSLVNVFVRKDLCFKFSLHRQVAYEIMLFLLEAFRRSTVLFGTNRPFKDHSNGRKQSFFNQRKEKFYVSARTAQGRQVVCKMFILDFLVT